MKSKTCFILLVLITLISSCEEKKEEKELKVITNYTSEVLDSSVTFNGIIADSSLISSIKECGFYWGTSNNLTINDNKVISTSIKPNFTSKIKGLKPNTDYFFKAYAINNEGTKYGDVVPFRTNGQPVINTLGITKVSYFKATCVVKLIDNNAGHVDSAGIVWSTNENPTLESNLGYIRKMGNVDSIIINNLQSNVTYYVRSYASNSYGTYYGEQLKFTTKAAPVSVSDIDGNTYKTVIIGSQVWMAENLAVTRFADGTKLAQVKAGDYETRVASYFWVNDVLPQYENEKNGAFYNEVGAGLTQSYTVSVQGVCPANWHLPSDNEWKELAVYLQKNGYNFDGTKEIISIPNRYPKIGKSLASKFGWVNDGVVFVDSLGAVGSSDFSEYLNKSGFNALPIGYLALGDKYYVILEGESAGFWSASKKVWGINFGSNALDFGEPFNEYYYFYSVRCIAND